MKKPFIGYARFSTDAQLNGDDQREELVAKFGDTHEIIAEYQDNGPGNLGVVDRPALKKLLADASKGEFDVLICTDLTRLTRRISPGIIMAIREAGVLMMTADGAEIGFADLVAHALMNQSGKTESQNRSERIKRGKRASKTAGSGKRPTVKK